ncbi:MAG: phosphatidylinositol mannoside acyltransferase [Actinomycetales bacterium]|nr:MAG: phosphatidylinositol mannoside acyltransferase [Actinomycetales bacterium]
MTALLWQVGWPTLRLMPSFAAYRLFDAVAHAQVIRGGRGVDRLRANYARVRPELDDRELNALVRAGMRSYMRYFCEALRLPDSSPARLDRMVRIVHEGPVRELRDAGRPVVFFLGHMGNWDAAGAWSTSHLAPVTAVAERLKPEAVFQEFVAYRESLGMTILPLTGGPDPFTALKEAVARGDFVTLLADRDLTAGGVEVDFCGHRARMAKGPAALALQTDTALFTVTIHYAPASSGRGMGGREVVVEFSPRIPVPEHGDDTEKVVQMTQACATYLGEAIVRHTEDWHMMQRVFVDDLDPARGR